MARPTFRETFINALRKAGGRSSNAQLRLDLGWSEEKYWKTHSELYDDGEIDKGRGYSGVVILTVPEENAQSNEEIIEDVTAIVAEPQLAVAVVQALEVAVREIDLYDPVKRQLDLHWGVQRGLDSCLTDITAMQGRRDTGGSWTRPDLVTAAYRTYEFIPGRVFELFSFEVKASNDVSIKGVMEALAHREAATRSFVIYCTDGKDLGDFSERDRIVDLAAKHGVGVYVAKDANDFDQWAEVVPAQRANSDPEVVDKFIKRTLSEESRTKIIKWFK